MTIGYKFPTFFGFTYNPDAVSARLNLVAELGVVDFSSTKQKDKWIEGIIWKIERGNRRKTLQIFDSIILSEISKILNTASGFVQDDTIVDRFILAGKEQDVRGFLDNYRQARNMIMAAALKFHISFSGNQSQQSDREIYVQKIIDKLVSMVLYVLGKSTIEPDIEKSISESLRSYVIAELGTGKGFLERFNNVAEIEYSRIDDSRIAAQGILGIEVLNTDPKIGRCPFTGYTQRTGTRQEVGHRLDSDQES